MSQPPPAAIVADLEALRARHGEIPAGARDKVIRHVDPHARAFLARCPFAVVATFGEDGADCSPRGDAPGFLRVLDETTLLIPDRPGNRRADTMSNVLARSRVGLLAMIPGMNETLRINGSAWIIDDPALLADSSVRGKAPTFGIWLHVEELYFHCAKALVRSELWSESHRIERSEFPTLGNMVLDQIRGARHAATDPVVTSVDASLEADQRDNLY